MPMPAILHEVFPKKTEPFARMREAFLRLAQIVGKGKTVVF